MMLALGDESNSPVKLRLLIVEIATFECLVILLFDFCRPVNDLILLRIFWEEIVGSRLCCVELFNSN